MTGAALATVDQLGAFLQQPLDAADPSAALMLDIASDMVRDYLQQQINLVTGEVVVVDPVNGVAFLPNLPVADVSVVETFDGTAWSVATSDVFTVSKATGAVAAKVGCGYSWPSDPGSWRITYTHGYETVPNSIIGAVLGVAARAYSTPPGADSERIGGYQVKYSMLADGFTPIEMLALNRYKLARVA